MVCRGLSRLRRGWLPPLVAWACAACGAGDGPAAPADPAARGPFAVGVTTLQVADPEDAGRDFAVEVWYPAAPPDGEPLYERTLGVDTYSLRDAPADRRGAPFPVVGFSHGRSGLRLQSLYLTQHLASHGYVVVAPDHRYDTFLDADDARAAEVLRSRPRTVRLALDALLARSASPDDPLAGLGDPARVGVVGHSFGGFTVLLLGGARMDLPALRAACAAQPDDLACGSLDDTITDAVVAGFADARVRATLALAPGGRTAFGPAGLQALVGPTLVQAGTLDTITPLATETVPIHEGLPAPTLLAELDGAAHFSFTDICALYEQTGGATGPFAFLATEGCGPDTVPIEQAHLASRALATAFLDLHLKGLPDERGILDPARGVPGARLRQR